MTDQAILEAVRRARRHLHRAYGYDPRGGHYAAVDEELNAIESELKRRQGRAATWQQIGPVQPGGKSLLDLSLTHQTSGLPLFPAVDTLWGAGGGVQLIAPEDCVVDTKDTSARPGEALYLTGRSGLRYWIGHITRDYPLGRRFAKGEPIALTIDQEPGIDHAHVGVNAEALLGKGKQLLYGQTGHGPDYTTGSPSIRNQLEKLEGR